MWGVALLLLAVFAASFVVEAGPVLWVAIFAGMAAYGRNPADPGAALLSAAVALVVLWLAQAMRRHR
jgi:hypothetical protein